MGFKEKKDNPFFWLNYFFETINQQKHANQCRNWLNSPFLFFL